MGRGDNRRTPKMRKRRAQTKFKDRVRKAIEAGKKKKAEG